MDDELVGRPKLGRTGVSGAGSVFENAKSQQAAVRQRIQEASGELEQFELSLPEERHRLYGDFQREEVGKVTDFVTRYEAMDRVVHGFRRSGPALVGSHADADSHRDDSRVAQAPDATR